MYSGGSLEFGLSSRDCLTAWPAETVESNRFAVHQDMKVRPIHEISVCEFGGSTQADYHFQVFDFPCKQGGPNISRPGKHFFIFRGCDYPTNKGPPPKQIILIHIYIYIYIHKYVYTHACADTRVYLYISLSLFVCIYIYIHIHNV